MAKKGGHIKVDSTMKARIRATRKIPPGLPEGLYISYKNQKAKTDSLKMKNDSIKQAADSLQRIVIELKANQQKK